MGFIQRALQLLPSRVTGAGAPAPAAEAGGDDLPLTRPRPNILTTFARNMFKGILQGNVPPKWDGASFLGAYSASPWLRATTDKIAYQIATAQWYVKGTKDKDTKKFVKAELMGDRRARMKALAMQGYETEDFPEHPLVKLLAQPCPYLPGIAVKMLWQTYIDIVGEAFFVIEREGGDGPPIALYPVPPYWVRTVPRPGAPFYWLQWKTLNMKIPPQGMYWDRTLDPADPYWRGSGLMMTLGDELAALENSSKLVNFMAYNRARPDMLISLPNFDEEKLVEFKQAWQSELKGISKVGKSFFTNTEAKVEKMATDFVHMQLFELQGTMRDTVRQTPGVPPEILGITETSNRATIDAADYIMAKHVTEPRLERMREFLNTHVVPEFDSRILLEYESPVELDKAFSLQTLTAMPAGAQINDWRKLAGLEPLDKATGGELFIVTQKASLKESLIEVEPPPVPLLPGGPGGAAPGGPLPLIPGGEAPLPLTAGPGGGAMQQRKELRELIKEAFDVPKLTPDARRIIERHLRLKGRIPTAATVYYCGLVLGRENPELMKAFGKPTEADLKTLDLYLEPIGKADRDYVRDEGGRFAETGGGGGSGSEADKGPEGGDAGERSAAGRAQAKEPTAPIPKGQTEYDPPTTDDADGDGVYDFARVGVPAHDVPPPPSIGRLPNLSADERAVESAFADAYQKDPEGVAEQFRQAVLAGNFKIKNDPPTFGTDDAKNLSPVWTPPESANMTPDQVKENRALYNLALHQTANAIAKKAFVTQLDEIAKLPPEQRQILVTAGGCGSGKGYALKNAGKDDPETAELQKHAAAVWDAAGDQNSTENPWIMEEAEKRGITPTFVWVDNDPVSAWEAEGRGIVHRANDEGRMVEAAVVVDSYALGAKNFKAFAERHEGKGKANFIYLDNSGKPKRTTGISEKALKLDRKKTYQELIGFMDKQGTKIKPHVRRAAYSGQRVWKKWVTP